MPVTPSYPGLYIVELPLSSHTITAAPTAIAVFVGHTHPYKTLNFRQAVRLFSFSEYEREFGGLFSSGLIEPHVPHAVNQFFLNGGSDAYVVGLEPKFLDASGGVIPGTGTFADTALPSAKVSATVPTQGLVFTAREPIDRILMYVAISNLKPSSPAPGAPLDIFDVTITYGSRVESYRGVTLNAGDPSNLPHTRIDDTSTLVKVAADSGGYGTDLTEPVPNPKPFTQALPAGFASTFSAQDFVDVFQANTSLDKVPIFNILLTPGISHTGINAAALAFAERKRAFVILDPPQEAAADRSSLPLTPIDADTYLNSIPLSQNGALYFPYLLAVDPLTMGIIEVAPSGYVAGIYARTDLKRGVWKAPAGLETTLYNTKGVVPRGAMTNEQQGVLYGTVTQRTPVNSLRSFPGTGTVVFGARTLVAGNPAFNQSKYIPVRRMTLFIEQTLLANLRWVVFEPNDEPLWFAIRTSIENFMLSLFNQGALQGTEPSEAFQVKCDKTTTTQDDINNGIVNIIVAFAPLKPAEFVIIKIAQLAGQTQA
jgi:phage tail sheath protein FI